MSMVNPVDFHFFEALPDAFEVQFRASFIKHLIKDTDNI